MTIINEEYRMRKKVSTMLISILAILTISSTSYASPKHINTKVKGSLESTHDIGCVDIKNLSNKYTPADLYKAVPTCIKEGKLDFGGQIFALASAYGRFDSERVADKTAHQGTKVLIMRYLSLNKDISKEEKKEFSNIIQKGLKEGSNKHIKLCADLVKIGSPDYYPDYMILHGMNAILGKNTNSNLVPGFNAEKAWKKTLKEYIHCSNLK